jgi:osmoprotectant transport system permease protein
VIPLAAAQAGQILHDLRGQLVGSLGQLPVDLAQHVLITGVALGAGIALSLPLAILASRRRWMSVAMLGGASLVQTVPGIALLALVYAVLVNASKLMQEPSSGAGGLPAVSFWTTWVALTLYSMLPVMRNTVTGLRGVDPALTEAARGVGMTPGQVLRKVELPLALPVIIAGIRTSTVWVVGIATLSTPVGQKSLGDLIFTGLQLENWGMALLGCLAAIVLAIVLDALIALLQRAAERRSRWRGIVAGAGLAAVLLGGLAPSAARHLGAASHAGAAAPPLIVGAKTFDEQFILASLIRDELEQAGLPARTREGLGSTIAFDALTHDEVDAYVDYSGTIWAVQMKQDRVADGDTVLRAVSEWLARTYGVTCLGRLGFANAYALAMRRDRADRLGIHSIADLVAHEDSLTFGGDYEFFGRPEWKSIVRTYGLRAPRTHLRTFQSTLMYQALRSGEVDVVSAFSSDGRIAAYDLRVLDDPKHALPPYDAILLVGRRAAARPGVLDALRPLIGRIPDDLMRQANYRVDRAEDKESPEQAAAWLRGRISADATGP